ncbi:hypothetical protein CVIRNUC_001090 [Coccomyxa viridis]|uniref:Cytidyltransferase-like domain-containing protein n=1 Tax=Coccomyxa viridis TaxID=1274662 RepID=A0AAV1HSN8_9CHLO|nr:hypothetical protein CVIRNUC_001090 [Coccomyxa viridis]
MQDLDERAVHLVRQIHGTNRKAVFYVAGGGVQVLTWLLSVPGASKTVLEARIPYGGGKSMAEILGKEPQTFANTLTAVEMARAAYRQAAHLSEFGVPILGVSCTCALATDRVKKGDHKVYVAIHDGHRTKALRIHLQKGTRNRLQEDDVASRLVLRSLAEGCGLEEAARSLSLGLRQETGAVVNGFAPRESMDGAAPQYERLQESVQSVEEPLQDLLDGRARSVEYSGGQVIVDAPRRGRVYLPGSFNPLHEGHKGLLSAALKTKGLAETDGCFELSVGNPDKGLLPLDEIKRRVAQFVEQGLPLVVTQAPLFTIKSKLFAKSTFVIGYDTAIRLIMPKYYGSEAKMLLELAAMRYRGCNLIVAGRIDDDRTFRTMSDVTLPDGLDTLGLFESIPEQLFRSDISSTELRNKGAGLA